MTIETAAPSGSGSGGGAPQLSFPRDIFAALSPAPFLLAHLDDNQTSTSTTSTKNTSTATRPNGRAPTEARTPTINASSLSHCNGSAVVRLGDTAVVAGVRAELLRYADVPNPPRYEDFPGGDMIRGGEDGGDDDDNDEEEEEEEQAGEAWDDRDELERLGLLVPNVELATGATPNVMPGAPPGAEAQGLTARLVSALAASRVVRGRDLRVVGEVVAEEGEAKRREVKAYWTLYVDVLFISLDGNAWDAAWGAVVAALRDTLLPKAWWDIDLGAVVCSEKVEEARALRLRGAPVAVSCAVFEPGKGRGKGGQDEEQERAWVLADPDAFEEQNCQEVVSVLLDVVNGKSVLYGIEKSGGGVVGRDVLHGVVKLAEERWKAWDQASAEAGIKG
ncbi:ribosomal protein S5 domain 2-type protein [Macrophomina phaseolina]|uniref:Ribosomal RNA-processing protein 43 n=1 Tax=Macrophomina phaseolina TaxID=35725 RepID=A0ABQ8GUU9_9PEZI|nr:ribosomal protein S5 domain 2-type protein [Macrophomina phaseolina]